MKVQKEHWDKLTDIENIRVNGYLSIQEGRINTLYLISIIFISFSIQNIFFLNFGLSFLFLAFSLIVLFVGKSNQIKTLQYIEEKYFKVVLKERRK